MKNLIVSYLVFKHVISLAKNMLTICTYIASTALLPFNPCNSCSLRATQPANPSSYLLNSKDDQHQTKHTQQACCPGVWRFGVRLSTFALARPLMRPARMRREVRESPVCSSGARRDAKRTGRSDRRTSP